MADPQQPGVVTNPDGSIRTPGPYNTQNPEQVINAYLQNHGVNPLNHSGPGEFMKAVMAKIVPQLFQMSFGDNGKMAMDQLANPASILDQIFMNGPNMGANLRDFANTAMSHLAGSPNMQNMSQPDMQNFLTSANAMQNFGNNPYESKANLQGLQDAFTQRGQGVYNYQNNLPGAVDPNQTLYQWIMQNAAGQLGMKPNSPASVLGGGLAPQGPQTNGGLGNGQPH